MDVSELRKQILHALDRARKDAADRRRSVDDAGAAYERFLEVIAGPLFKQAATVLRGEGHDFTVHTPAGSVRVVSDRSPQDFIELELEAEPAPPHVVGRTSLARGRKNPVVEEHPLAAKPVAELTEQDVSAFLVAEIPKLVGR